ncbi:MAG: prepilin-type N-terminal cleavage/methylation domain-containing protein [Lachnospiraceae bacterium]|nr:prepilin-type N-terminal cleavage/methylation domain-containing protein [Lachnospiraceae bacterium]
MTGENKQKLNKNAGFSLVELLIAITILAIIVIPLLNVFLTSNKLNIKSRQTLRATTMAQDIMEGLKAYNIDELKEQFKNPSEGFYVIDDSIIKGEIKEEFSLEVDEHGDPCEGLYYFSLSKVTLQGTEYDALIKVDAREYMEGGSHTNNQKNMGADGSTPVAHNNDGIAKVGNVNNNDKKRVNKDGLFEEKDMHDEIWKLFKEKFEENDIEEDEICYNLPGFTGRRTFWVEIEDSGSKDEENNIIADATIKTEYEFSYEGELKSIIKTDVTSFSSGNLYFFYYPQYFYSVMTDEDNIEVDNKDNLDLCMTIVKQINEMVKLTDAQLSIKENQYRVIAKFKNCDADNLKVRTNLGINLVNSKYLGAEGKLPEVPNQVTFILNGAERHDLNIYDLSGVRNTSLGAAGTDDEITELIYDVEVAIYQEGAAAGGFQDEDKKIIIEGSKNN